jgi:hypothetical protein
MLTEEMEQFLHLSLLLLLVVVAAVLVVLLDWLEVQVVEVGIITVLAGQETLLMNRLLVAMVRQR